MFILLFLLVYIRNKNAVLFFVFIGCLFCQASEFYLLICWFVVSILFASLFKILNKLPGNFILFAICYILYNVLKID